MGREADVSRGRLIAFEGVDGAGKSTVIGRVAEHLRGRGERVFMPRTGKEHVSRPTRMIRRLTRDRRNLDLGARAELLLYCAREAQLLEELVRPALRRGETVLIDRSLLTPVVLGRARGLAEDECERSAAVAAAGLEPDITLVFDVHPRTSRIRKRVERIRNHSLDEEGGRKGLAGSAMKERVRSLYRELAQARGYALFHVERATPEQLTDRVLRVLEHGGPIDVGESAADRQPSWMVPADWTLEAGLEAQPLAAALFLANGLIAARALRERAAELEPALAAWSMDPEDPLRARIAASEPEYALRALSRMPFTGEGDLRLRLLDHVPHTAIAALKHLSCAASDAVRAQHADAHPDAVLLSLTGREDDRAEALRDQCWKAASDDARATSLGYCRSDKAWKRREALLDKHPALALRTLRGICDPRADRWLERYADVAPKVVLTALGGRSDAAAHALRDALFETGREVVDSVRGLEDPQSWTLRERALERWPSTVVHSMLGLPQDDRARAMVQRCLSVGAGDLHVLRRVQALEERAQWPDWARQRTMDEAD